MGMKIHGDLGSGVSGVRGTEYGVRDTGEAGGLFTILLDELVAADVG